MSCIYDIIEKKKKKKKTYFFSSPEIPSCILSEFLRFNRHIKIDNEPVFFKLFLEHGINFVYQLCDKNGIKKNGKFFKLNIN